MFRVARKDGCSGGDEVSQGGHHDVSLANAVYHISHVSQENRSHYQNSENTRRLVRFQGTF